jgi:ankyrin repeat protein
MDATAFGSTDAVKLLLDRGADPNAKNAFGATALMWAAGDIEKVRLLVGKGADVNARSNIGRTPLLIAALYDDCFELAKLLEKGADGTACDKLGFTVLEAAAQGNDTASVRLLLAHGGDVKAKNGAGVTALTAATRNGIAEVVKLLLARGSDVGCHAQNLTGMAVKVASMNGAEVDGKLDARMARDVFLLQARIEQTLMQLVDAPPGQEGMEYSMLQFGAVGVPPSPIRLCDTLRPHNAKKETGRIWTYHVRAHPGWRLFMTAMLLVCQDVRFY